MRPSLPSDVGPNCRLTSPGERSVFPANQPFMRLTLTALILGAVALPGFADDTALRTHGSLRVRQEAWDWFNPAGNFQNAYTFTGAALRVGATRSSKSGESVFELAAPLLIGLPTRASAPAPAGGLGLGALYRALNGSREGDLFVKQAFHLDRRSGIRAGRFEFGDGGESVPKDPNLAWVKGQRVAQRLIGTFGWTHVGRSFDGLHWSRSSPSGSNVTAVLAHPTRGVFELRGQETLSNVRFAYGSATSTTAREDRRVFGILYEDRRPAVVKVDNRPAAVLATDFDPVRIATVGGHVAAVRGRFDWLGWAALQAGDWGVQRHQAHALALEGGWRPPKAPHGLWLRAGANVYSGDKNPSDNTHGTFYPLLNTPRLYARTPFYGESNVRDLFMQAILRPDARTVVRADIHRTSLDKTSDRWYAAGGPFTPSGNFGLIGRPNPAGSRDIATLVDIGVDRTLDPRTTVGVYLGWMRGHGVVQGIYPDKDGWMGFLEATRKF